MLHRAVSTISYEISTRSKKHGVYDPEYADHHAYVQRTGAKYQGMKIVDDADLKSFVDHALSKGRSPESIAGRLKHQEKQRGYVSKEGIRTYLRSVYGRKLEVLRNKLVSHRKRRNKRVSQGEPSMDVNSLMYGHKLSI
jgi:IS30 family transposase